MLKSRQMGAFLHSSGDPQKSHIHEPVLFDADGKYVDSLYESQGVYPWEYDPQQGRTHQNNTSPLDACIKFLIQCHQTRLLLMTNVIRT